VRGEDLGKLILRLTIGGLMLAHGINKILNGIGWMDDLLVANGLPKELKYGVYVGEVVAPLLVILGFLTRPAALIIVINMAMAVFLVQRDKLATLNQTGGWGVELEALFLFGALAIAFLGAGRMSLRGGAAKVD
jgi:putative oxidoreductase